MALNNSSTVSAGDDATATQYNNLREDVREANHRDFTAGESLTGETTPQPVYISQSDGKIYRCDANDTDKLKFVGFVDEDASADATGIQVQMDGIEGGFTGLTAGAKYYVSDTIGTISTTPGTYQILVGVAISATEIFIMKGRRVSSGLTDMAGVSTSVITLGFRPIKIHVMAFFVGADSQPAYSNGIWTPIGGNRCIYFQGTEYETTQIFDGVAEDTSSIWRLRDSGIDKGRGIIDTVTETSFRFNQQEGGSTSNLHWVAEGDL